MKKHTPIIILLIIAMLLPTIVIPASAASASLDYSDPSSPVKVDMSASELLEFALGGSIPEIEKTYLDAAFGDVFSYSEFVPQKQVETVYDFGTLSISASKYEFTSASGKVTWTPTTATIEGKTSNLIYSASSGKYEGKIEGLSASDGEALTVTYTCSLGIGADVVNTYVNFTYDKAVLLKKEKDDYEKEQAAFEARKQYLEALAEYNKKKQAYDTYVSDKKKYDKNLAAFEKYEDDLAEYKIKYEEYKKASEEFNNALKEFNKKKKAYEEYLAEKKIYEEELKEYQLYMAEIERFSTTLEVIDSVYTYDSQGRQLYGLLTGGTVDYVLAVMEENLHLLEGTNISEGMVRSTGRTTAALQVMLEEYGACSTTEQKVQYYKENYTSISNCFSSLSDSLYYMFHDPTLHSLLYKKDTDHSKFSKFMHMLAQLYVVETGLKDTVGRNENWSLTGEPDLSNPFVEKYFEHGFKDLLEDVHIVPDKNMSNPAKLGELPKIVYEPVEPVEAPEPGEQPKDPGLSIPVEPDEVKDPGDPPAEVKDPGAAPTEVKGPETAPELLHHTAEEKALIEALENGTVKKRSTLSAKTMNLTTKVTKTLVLEDKCIITFYDHDGVTELYTVIVDKGDKITYGGKAPERAETDKYKYEFEGWKNDEGTLVASLGVAEEQHIDFYASYKADIKSYQITWIVNGEKTTETYPYGETPTFKGTPSKPETKQYTYTFKGWSTPVAAVTGDATYEAVFSETVRIYIVTWVFGPKETKEEYRYGETPSYKLSTDKFLDGQFSYEFTGWDKEFATVEGDATYTAQFKKVNIFEDDEPEETMPPETPPETPEETTPPETPPETPEETMPPETPPETPDETMPPETPPETPEETTPPETPPETPEETTPPETPPETPDKPDIPDTPTEEKIKVELIEDVYKVTTIESSAKINTVLEFAEYDERTVTVYFKNQGASIVLNEAMVSKLVAADCNKAYIYINEENIIENALGAYSVKFTDKAGNAIDLGSSVTLRLELGGKASASTKAYTVGANGETEPLACVYEDGAVTVKLSGSAEVVLRNEYKIAANKCENGVLSTDKVSALAGETVKVSLSFSDSYEVVYIQVVGALTGHEYELSEDGTFTMPEEDISVHAMVKPKEYTVKFVVDGVVISEEKYQKGATVTLPAEPTKESDGEKVYTFIGWSPAVTIVSEDAVYTAEFSEADLGVERPDVNTDKTRYYTIIAIAVVGILLVVVGIPTAIVLVVKHNKKKKAQRAEKETIADTTEDAESDSNTDADEGSEKTDE